MKQRPSGLLKTLVIAVAVLSALAACVLGASQPTLYAVGTFQREVDTPSPSTFGTAILQENGSSQIFSVTINDLSKLAGETGGSGSNASSESFAVFTSIGNSTNIPVSLIGPLNLLGSNDTWVLRYEGEGAAPAQLGVADLRELSGLYLVIANPGPTNIVNGVTNYFVNAVLFTQIPEFTTKSKAPHFNRKSKLTTISVPPNPQEKGWIKASYSGSQGRSFFDISAFHLSGGGSYSIFVQEPPSSSTMSNIGALVISTNSIHTGTYSRDTRKGETLPLNSATVTNLSGRAIQIQDAFHEIHLQGVIP